MRDKEGKHGFHGHIGKIRKNVDENLPRKSEVQLKLCVFIR